MATKSVVTGDINRDGNVDIISTAATDGTVRVMLGNGNGSFSSAVSFAAGANANSVVLADFNADGRTDLAVSDGIGTKDAPLVVHAGVLDLLCLSQSCQPFYIDRK